MVRDVIRMRIGKTKSMYDHGMLYTSARDKVVEWQDTLNAEEARDYESVVCLMVRRIKEFHKATEDERFLSSNRAQLTEDDLRATLRSRR